ncbi:MAG TPA: polysaccharide biosynthesis tyrosine autokinase, partial [Gemmatimonadaceae bacterium]|nr:polysaccharide biosynthesis tyrosine autokinase [Gemmatimonadaceae bacterium]
WLVAGITALGTAAGVVATRSVQPTYEAHGAVWIPSAGFTNGGGNNGAFRQPDLLPAGSWLGLIRSFAVVDRVVAQMHLWYTPKLARDSTVFAGLMPTGRTIGGDYTLSIDPTGTHYMLSELMHGVVDRGLVGDSIGRQVGLAWAPSSQQFHPNQIAGLWVKQPRAIAVALIQRLEVSAPEQSNFMNLDLTGGDKVQTAGVLNTWMQAFVDQAAELRGQNMSEVAHTLEEQRNSADAAMNAAGAALQAYRSQNMTKPGEGVSTSAALPGGTAGDVLFSEYFKAQADYESTRRDRQALDDVAAHARAGTVSPDEIAAIPAVVANAPSLMQTVKDLINKEQQLNDLKQTLQDAHPKVVALVADINTIRTQTIPDQAANAASVLLRHESDLKAKLVEDSLKLTDIPARSIEEARLRRNLADAEAVHTAVQGRYEAAKLGSEGTASDVRILDRALPSSTPQKNIILLMMVGGFGGSFVFGIVLALLLDMIDPRFRYQEQITHELKLDVLGAVPSVPKPGDTHSNPDAMLQSVEAFRGLRMNLRHAFNSPPVLLTVTSPGAGDGKSMVVSNLALSFSEAGYRTLLIDGDIRRGKLHSVFGTDRRPGLLDYLAGDVEAHTILREVPMHVNLTLIPGGTRRHRGPELLTSARLPALLDMVRSRFDVILVDSAPLAAGVDAYALGVATGSMVLVMRTGVTDRRVAKAKLKLVERLPIRLLGAVVNAVPGAGLYTEYSYLHGYSPDID